MCHFLDHYTHGYSQLYQRTMFPRTDIKSKRGTAVDQWGWDSKEMRVPFTHDKDAWMMWCKHGSRGVTSFTLQIPPCRGSPYSSVKAVRASTVRPVCIGAAIRGFLAKGLAACCKTSFTQVFQKSHSSALQFGVNKNKMGPHTFPT